METVSIIDNLFILLGKERGTQYGLRGSGGSRWVRSESYFPLANINLFCFIQSVLSSLKVPNFCLCLIAYNMHAICIFYAVNMHAICFKLDGIASLMKEPPPKKIIIYIKGYMRQMT